MSPTEEIFGSLSSETLTELAGLRQTITNLTQEIGGLEIKKARILGTIGEVERRAENLVNQEAVRLGIPEGQRFQISPEGHVRAVPTM